MACVDDDGLSGAYVYLLGIYLGDGMLSAGRRNVWRLRVSQDLKYPDIIARIGHAISEVAAREAGHVGRPGCVEIYSDWKHWLCVFPQHGPGPKHERSIRLESWQEGLVRSHPGPFLAGLIHSDGCRMMNRVKTYSYARYFFTNASADIRELFVTTCARVLVETRQDGVRNISVAQRASVEILDRLVGPKS